MDKEQSAMSKRIFLIVVILFFLVSGTLAQETKEDFKNLTFREKLFFGGNFGLVLGTITDIEISPIVGYRLTWKLSFGAGPKYEFYKDSRVYAYTLNNNNYNYQPKTHIYGGRVFVSYHLFHNINDYIPVGIHAGLFLHSEYEALSLENEDFRPWVSLEGRYVLHSVLVGGGLSLPLGKRGAFNVMVLWNLNESADSPYASPMIRFGFQF